MPDDPLDAVRAGLSLGPPAHLFDGDDVDTGPPPGDLDDDEERAAVASAAAAGLDVGDPEAS